MSTLISYPATNRANTLNCIEICLEGSDEDFIENAGSVATATVSIGGTIEATPDGTTFILAGITFTIRTVVVGLFNSTEIQFDGNATIFRDRLFGALGLNYNFEDVTITTVPAPIGIDLVWNSIGIQPDFDFDVSFAFIVTEIHANGTNFILKNKRLLYQLYCVVDGGTDLRICDPQNPSVHTKGGSIIPNCFNTANEINDVLKTTAPALDSTQYIDETIKKTFYLKHGTVEYINVQIERNDWRYGYIDGEGELADTVTDVKFNLVSIPLAGYPYDVSTAVGLDQGHALAVDLKAWLISEGYVIDQVGVIHGNSGYFAMFIRSDDFDALPLTFVTDTVDPSGVWEKRSTEIILNCNDEYGDYIKEDDFQVINALHRPDDLTKLLEYVASATGNMFLTGIPSGSTVCCDTFRWLWLCFLPDLDTAVFVTLTFIHNGIETQDDQPIVVVGDVLVLAAGPANIALFYPAINFTDLDSYSLQVRTLDPGIINLSEKYEFKMQQTDCCCEVQIYYKTDIGGFDTLCFDKIQSIDYEVEQVEICTDVNCGGSILEGRGMVNGSLKEKITLITKKYQRTMEQRDIFMQFKKSNSRMIKAIDLNGDDVLRTFIVDAGGVRIFEAGGKLTVSVSGYYEETESTQEF